MASIHNFIINIFPKIAKTFIKMTRIDKILIIKKILR